MQSIAPIINFIKISGGPRNFIYIVLFLILGGVLIFQYLRNRKAGETNYIFIRDRKLFSEGNKFRDTLIAGIAVILIISYMFIVSLLIYLLFVA